MISDGDMYYTKNIVLDEIQNFVVEFFIKNHLGPKYSIQDK